MKMPRANKGGGGVGRVRINYLGTYTLYTYISIYTYVYIYIEHIGWWMVPIRAQKKNWRWNNQWKLGLKVRNLKYISKDSRSRIRSTYLGVQATVI